MFFGSQTALWAVPDKVSNNFTPCPHSSSLIPEKVGQLPPKSFYCEESYYENILRWFSLTSKTHSLIKCKWELTWSRLSLILDLGAFLKFMNSMRELCLPNEEFLISFGDCTEVI